MLPHAVLHHDLVGNDVLCGVETIHVDMLSNKFVCFGKNKSEEKYWNGSSTANPVQEREPAHVQHLLELHLVSRGWNLRELAALAPVLLNQVSQEYLGWSDEARRTSSRLRTRRRRPEGGAACSTPGA